MKENNMLVFAFVNVMMILGTHSVTANNLDRFTYGATQGNDYGPEHWSRITCDDVQKCKGYPDDWKLALGWQLSTENSCRWCPADGSVRCGRHHQSPINLERSRAIPGHLSYKECLDDHWMKYEDSSCTWDRLIESQAFSIERHSLRINQPLELEANFEKGVRLDCPGGPRGRRFGRIDFSEGFGSWWFLSHTDIKVPSEHTQEGKRYAAEVQLAHFYSVGGHKREMAHVSVFLDASGHYPSYPHLDRLICQWRKAEEATRAECGLDPVKIAYPGCFLEERPPTPTPSPAIASLTNEYGFNNNFDQNHSTIQSSFLGQSPQSMTTNSEACESTLKTDSTCYEVGQDIRVQFSNCEPQPDDWVGIYFADESHPEEVRTIIWLYACGDQQCFEAIRNETMTFGEGTLGELYQEEWPLPPGSYKMVIGRDGRRPYDLYSISNAFEVIENGRVCFSRGKHRMLRKSAGDLVHRSSTTNTITNASSNEFKLEIDPINWRAPDMTEEEWVDFIQGISNQDHDRHLLESSHIPFHNYQFLIDVRTEYYFRYGGTQTVPPCHAPLIKGEQHANTNHWRVMKDPIRVSTRQIIELERLLRERIAPRQTNGAASCMPDTAGKISGDGHHISVARPLMKTSSAHRMVFCDCGDWKSKWPEDQAWCQMREQKQRYFEHPYNFDTDSF